MNCFVSRISEYFGSLNSMFCNNWMDIALEVALKCKNRHIAGIFLLKIFFIVILGQSFQIASILCRPYSFIIFPKILTRLLEHVGDPNENSQGYLIDLMNCMSSIIHFLPIYDKNVCSKSITNISNVNFHFRSVSYTPNISQKNACTDQIQFKDCTNGFVSDIIKKGYYIIKIIILFLNISFLIKKK